MHSRGLCNLNQAVDSDLNDPTRLLVSFVITGVFEGNMSVRGIEAMISLFFQADISHQTLLKILEYTADIAARLNEKLRLDEINCAIFDEIFQGKSPILSMADPVSGLIFLRAGKSRTGEEWEEFLVSLRKLGLSPESVNTDGGQGLLKGIKLTWESAIKIRDLFSTSYRN